MKRSVIDRFYFRYTEKWLYNSTSPTNNNAQPVYISILNSRMWCCSCLWNCYFMLAASILCRKFYIIVFFSSLLLFINMNITFRFTVFVRIWNALIKMKLVKSLAVWVNLFREIVTYVRIFWGWTWAAWCEVKYSFSRKGCDDDGPISWQCICRIELTNNSVEKATIDLPQAHRRKKSCANLLPTIKNLTKINICILQSFNVSIISQNHTKSHISSSRTFQTVLSTLFFFGSPPEALSHFNFGLRLTTGINTRGPNAILDYRKRLPTVHFLPICQYWIRCRKTWDQNYSSILIIILRFLIAFSTLPKLYSIRFVGLSMFYIFIVEFQPLQSRESQVLPLFIYVYSDGRFVWAVSFDPKLHHGLGSLLP